MQIIHWQYVKDLNNINKVILLGDENWDGLKDASQIISITYDSNQGCYVVFWLVDARRVDNADSD